jgi:type III secretory pathway component EscV
LAVTIAVIAVYAITLLLILGAIITPYSMVFAKKHSNGGNNNDNDQKQKDDSSNGTTLRKTNPLIPEISLPLQTEIHQHHHLFRHFYQSIHQLQK